MRPRAVFVETNWIVDVVAPIHLQSPQAIQLLQSAAASELELYIPSICLTEARETVPRRFASPSHSRADDLRKFVRWAGNEGLISADDSSLMFAMFNRFEAHVKNELRRVEILERLAKLKELPGLNVFPLSESMLERQVDIGSMDLVLEPYDLAILAAVLVKSEELKREGHSWFGFCELDSDLWPWHKKTGTRKPVLSDLYDNARIWVYSKFSLEEGVQLPDGWTTSA